MITRCTQSAFIQGYGKVSATCGETVEVCGRAYQCECEKCSDTPDYATRMSRGRRATYTPPDEDKGIVLFSVEYEDGKCEGVARPDGPVDRCSVRAWDDSHVGGCHRRTDDPETGTFECGESVTVCGDVEVQCECLDGGVQQVRISGAIADR